MDTLSSAAADPASLVGATEALEALNTARDAVLSYQAAVKVRLDAAQAKVVEAQKLVETAQAELAVVARDRDYWRAEAGRQTDFCHALEAQLASQRERNQNLNSELLELYRDLRAEDLHTLILRICINLIGAENGLYVEADGDGTVASIALDNLPETSNRTLYDYTRQAAQGNEPVVNNNEQSLPDGRHLVNLAAMPVVLQSTLKGIILVANKRSGPITEADTELLLSVGRHAGIALENQRLHCALSDSYLSTIAVLADAIEVKDPYTRGHCESVAAVAVRVAQRMGFAGDDLDQLRYAALLHDVGKIGIPDGILLKPGRLSPEEFQVIQRHTIIGSDLVSRVDSLAPIAPVVLHHHERYDGTGYPHGLSGDNILLPSRIVGVVDALDAMTTPRPYREPVTIPEALCEIQRCSGTQFDPAVVVELAEVLAQ
ncbi:MAG: HD domain-containing protein [Armatimonadota bacterium]|nr:HD domain-containing protein [Armatimonadota bacterium]